MASSQEIRIPMAVMNEILKMEKKMNESSIPNSQDYEAYTDATMKNIVYGDLTLLNSHNYSGSEIGLYPSPIETNQSQGFVHKAVLTTDPDGSMGCVVYSGYNDTNTECAWLLAWHTPIGGPGCKVYVECGRVAPYKPEALDWDTIKQKLENSTNKSSFKHRDTKVQVSAEIQFDNGTADLVSIFDLLT